MRISEPSKIVHFFSISKDGQGHELRYPSKIDLLEEDPKDRNDHMYTSVDIDILT